ncbi:MAG: RluA family pseudouridine synthase [Flavobacteriales bacterium]|nr:RluA family pseudouridine synthase [Flavobacteriales bacterium]MCX7767486.1 RluA family pseudouridine synthase [Flavobacteriales bacterium]MDW8409622.1 RluA family pseudouridine synthase [Flavobacteriales bacterium]
MDIQAGRILYEDNHIIAVNKLPGEIVQSDSYGDESLVEWTKKYLKIRYNKPGNVFCGVVHRLDRPVSGVVLFARTSKALTRLNGMLRDRKIRKIYWLITRQAPPSAEGIAEGYIWRKTSLNKSFFSPEPLPGALPARLTYRHLHAFRHHNLVEVDLHTGRHHQIRATMEYLGCPIAGDVKYGDEKGFKDRSIALHARMVQFQHPVSGSPLIIKAPLPTGGIWEKLKVPEIAKIF